jgi:hypothetical protein
MLQCNIALISKFKEYYFKCSVTVTISIFDLFIIQIFGLLHLKQFLKVDSFVRLIILLITSDCNHFCAAQLYLYVLLLLTVPLPGQT